jgi:hypothetical protein
MINQFALHASKDLAMNHVHNVKDLEGCLILLTARNVKNVMNWDIYPVTIVSN